MPAPRAASRTRPPTWRCAADERVTELAAKSHPVFLRATLLARPWITPRLCCGPSARPATATRASTWASTCWALPPLIGTFDHQAEATRCASSRCPRRWRLTIRSASRIPIDYKKRFQQFKARHRDRFDPRPRHSPCAIRKTQMRRSRRRRYRGKRPSSSSSAVALWATVRFVHRG